ncbi:MAG: hypothetical protein KKD44_24665 [Proteobacteria bacterium]|nr:hypothetical protein [Pseudomonadota bacterium]
MKTWFENLKFTFLLYALYVLIRLTAWRSNRLMEKLKEKDMVLVMRSKGGAISRTIRCNQGHVRSQKGHAGDAVSFITWASPSAGSRVMINIAKGHSKALFKAVIAGDLVPEGDAAGIKWFMDVVALLSRVYHKKKPKPSAQSNTGERC